MSNCSERMGRSWGRTVEGDGAMRIESYRVESYGIESYRVESGTTKKRASKISLQSSLK